MLPNRECSVFLRGASRRSPQRARPRKGFASRPAIGVETPVALVSTERCGRPLTLAAFALAVLRLSPRGCCFPFPIPSIPQSRCCLQGLA
jgi:hypothetical protein